MQRRYYGLCGELESRKEALLKQVGSGTQGSRLPRARGCLACLTGDECRMGALTSKPAPTCQHM